MLIVYPFILLLVIVVNILNHDGEERIMYNDTFDGFPMFTRDGKKLVFASNRNSKVRGEIEFVLGGVEGMSPACENDSPL